MFMRHKEFIVLLCNAQKSKLHVLDQKKKKLKATLTCMFKAIYLEVSVKATGRTILHTNKENPLKSHLLLTIFYIQ